MKAILQIASAITIAAMVLAFQNCSPKSEMKSDGPSNQGNGGGAATCSVTHSDGNGNTAPSFTTTVALSGAIENSITSSVPDLEVWAIGSNNGTAIAPVQLGTLIGGSYIWHPCWNGAGGLTCPAGTYVRSYELKNSAGTLICTTNVISTTIN